MERKTWFLGLLLASLLFVRCASNPYEKFYSSDGPQANAYAKVAPPTQPQLLRGGDPEADEIAMFERGFNRLGYSSFNGRSHNTDEAVSYGKRVRADVVVVYSRYTDTLNSTIPLVLPNAPTTSTTTLQGTVSGSGGYSNFSGTANTTTTGGYTVHPIQRQVQRFDQAATYWAGGRPSILGVHVRDLNDKERHELERNRGAVIVAVTKGSAAFRGDLLRGDVITELNEEEILDDQDFLAKLRGYAGQKVTLNLMRGGLPRKIEIQLDSPKS